MKYTVDRFEDSIAILEREVDCKMVEINRSKLPIGVKDGDLLLENNGVYTVLVDETKEQKEKITNLINSLFED